MPSASPAGPGLTGSSAALTAPTQSIVKVNIATIAITLISFFISCTAISLQCSQIRNRVKQSFQELKHLSVFEKTVPIIVRARNQRMTKNFRT
jgi:hypothetical protein